MKKLVLTAALILFMAGVSRADAKNVNGEVLLEHCMSDSLERKRFCKGYIFGTVDTAVLVMELEPDLRRRISYDPGDMELSGRLVETVIRFLRSQSQEKTADGRPILTIPAMDLVWLALRMESPSVGITGRYLFNMCTSHFQEDRGLCAGYILGAADMSALIIGLMPEIRRNLRESSRESGDDADMVEMVIDDLSRRPAVDAIFSSVGTISVWSALGMIVASR